MDYEIEQCSVDESISTHRLDDIALFLPIVILDHDADVLGYRSNDSGSARKYVLYYVHRGEIDLRLCTILRVDYSHDIHAFGKNCFGEVSFYSFL